MLPIYIQEHQLGTVSFRFESLDNLKEVQGDWLTSHNVL